MTQMRAGRRPASRDNTLLGCSTQDADPDQPQNKAVSAAHAGRCCQGAYPCSTKPADPDQQHRHLRCRCGKNVNSTHPPSGSAAGDEWEAGDAGDGAAASSRLVTGAHSGGNGGGGGLCCLQCSLM